MSLIERITKAGDAGAWYGDMPIENRYTAGIAGERFLRALKDKGVIMGANCPKCQLTYVPPRLFCERCFSPLEEWVEVGKQGTVETYTVLHVDLDSNPLDEPKIVALVNIDGTYGGLIHFLGQVELDELYIGLPVEAVFKPKREREGSILDIRYFKPG
jgi:uncharacterized OB-fold protein